MLMKVPELRGREGPGRLHGRVCERSSVTSFLQVKSHHLCDLFEDAPSTLVMGQGLGEGPRHHAPTHVPHCLWSVHGRG